MQAQTIPEPVTNGASQPGPSGSPKSTTDSLVDSALDALGDLAGPPDNANGRKPARQPRSEEDGPDREDGDTEVEEPLPVDAEDAEDEGGEADADEEGEPHDTRGSKEEPFSVKDLPDDRFIELKVDGEKTVVSLKELANGYIRENTFSARINKTKQLADEAQAHIARAKETRESVKLALKDFLGDPDQMFEHFMADPDKEPVLLALAQRYAAQSRRFRESPQERLAFERDRELRRIEADKQRWEAQKQAEVEEKQRAAQQERAFKVFKPGWESGLRKAGFPQGTPEQMRELFSEVQLRCDQRHRAGHEVTSDDVTEFVVRAAKLLELPRRGDKRPRPAPAAAPKEREPSRRKGDPWAGKPRSEKVKSPDFFLQSLRPRDFR